MKEKTTTTKSFSKTLKCKHYKGEGYGYDMGEGQILCLCEQCHMNIAGDIFKQVAQEVLISGFMRRK